MKLTIKEVRDVLYPIRFKWYSLGIQLNLNAAELDIIRSKYVDPGDCLIEMIKLWLKFCEPHPTWKALANALSADSVNEKAIAKKGIAA